MFFLDLTDSFLTSTYALTQSEKTSFRIELATLQSHCFGTLWISWASGIYLNTCWCPSSRKLEISLMESPSYYGIWIYLTSLPLMSILKEINIHDKWNAYSFFCLKSIPWGSKLLLAHKQEDILQHQQRGSYSTLACWNTSPQTPLLISVEKVVDYLRSTDLRFIPCIR